MAYTSKTIDTRLCEIRSYFNLTNTQLAAILGITRQAIHRWRDGKSLPCLKIYWRIEALYTTAVRFRDAEILEPRRLIHLPIFKGHTLIELIQAGKEYGPAISYLIMEQRRALSEPGQLQLSLAF